MLDRACRSLCFAGILIGASAATLAQGLGERELEEAGGRAGPARNPADVRVVRDVAYGDDATQRFDVYAPAQAANAPVIFMVHGGAWRIGDKDMRYVVENKVARWVPRGFVFISTNYRMVPNADALEQAHDVARALAAAQRQAGQWGGDPHKFILMGHSAGAHLVALLGASSDLGTAHGVQPWLGVVALDSGAIDVPRIMSQRHFRFYDRAFGSQPERWQAASPLHALASQRPPLLLVCSTRREGPCEEADDFKSKAAALGTRVDISRQDKRHGAINQELGLPSAYTDIVERFMASLDDDVARRLGTH